MASRGKTCQLKNMYIADFETCDAWPADDGLVPDQRVWLAGLKNLQTDTEQYFENIDQFMNKILSRGDNVNSEIAFHNLKFDGSFIVPWLLSHGWQHTHDFPIAGEFNVLIDERNSWYSLTIQVTSKRKVTLWDSLKLFPTALEYLPDMYNTPTKKIAEDDNFYSVMRPSGHVPTRKELSYLHNDLCVLSETLQEHIRLYGLRFKKTQAAQAFHNFEKHFKAWKLRFPPLTVETDSDIRPAYWGGISYVNPLYQGKDCYNIGSYDINSSYPFQLATKRLPYGRLLYTFGNHQHPDMSKFWVAKAQITFTLKPDKVPCVPLKSVTQNRPITQDKWLADSNGIIECVFSCIDYQLMAQCYDLVINKWLWSYHWAWKVQPEVRSFIETNNAIKVESRMKAKNTKDETVKRQLMIKANRAKIDNNSFYGKFGEDIVKRSKTPYLINGDTVYRDDHEETQKESKRRFLPVAIATTAYGRSQLIQMANLLGQQFIYSDTDSIHYFKKEGDKIIRQAQQKGMISIDSVQLGSWDYEGTYKFGRYLRPKCYMEGNHETHQYDVTLAGLPADKHSGHGSKKRSFITFDNFHIGLIIPQCKLRTVRTKTGSKLVRTDFQIKEVYTIF